MSISGEMIILSDWNKQLEAYSIPESLINLINNESFNDEFVSSESDYSNDDVRFYFGNIPSEDLLKNFKNLEWVHFGSIGIDKLSENFIKDHSLTITNGSKTNSSAVVTYCMGEIFRSCKSGFLSRNSHDSIELTRKYYNIFYEYMIDYNDIDLCLLGYGDIGQELVSALSSIVKTIHVVTKTKREDFKNVKFYSLDEINIAVTNISHMVNVLPLHNETRGIINREVLSEASNFYYICAGRAETHVHDDILKLLKSGDIRGASLDVHGLPNGKIQESTLSNNKIHLSPHISGWTKSFWGNQGEIILYNIKKANEDDHKSMKNIIYNRGVKVK